METQTSLLALAQLHNHLSGLSRPMPMEPVQAMPGPDIAAIPAVRSGASPAHPVHEADTIGATPNSRGFTALLSAYRATGGAVRRDELVRLLDAHRPADLSSLARLIVSGGIFSFEWRNTSWVPMFQFEPCDLSVRQGPRKVLGELATVFDRWTLAAWFAQPNSWLKGFRPVDLLASNLPAVVAAARADRFVAAG